ncbi:2-aminoadipate transaminase [Roseovarius albus]|uniref:2-aminoadipate transaminase n=2 Tax=Roseovarius albus TaxID=1247867 RepID=A0A1X6YYV8_9RHOB|nr:2-aminoadipate transaminase [Roseovarius albus]
MTDTIWHPDFANIDSPKYIVLVQSMRAAVRSGVLKQGYKMPPVRELAWQLGITPGTVARAYRLAAEEGLVETGVGRGTFVSGGLVTQDTAPESLLNDPEPGTVDFRGVRVPDVGQDKEIQRIMMLLARDTGRNYTDVPSAFTDQKAREAVVHWIGPDRAGRLSKDDVVLGFGAQNTVILALQTCLHGPSPVILTEELAYPGVRHASRLLRAQLIGIAMDDEGMRPDRLEEALRKHGGQVLLTFSEVHSPTTSRTSLQRRQEIAEIARRYQLQIIEDDSLCVTRPEAPSYRGICPERAWYVSSLSKSVSAAMRFGYVVCPRDQAAQARQVAQSSFYGLPQTSLDICAELIQSGVAETVRQKVEQVILERVRIAVNVLGQWEINWRPDVPFIWLKLPQGWRGSTFARACEAEGVRIKPSDEFALPDGHAPNAVRLGLNANVSKETFEKALRTMSRLLARPPANVDL